MVSDKGDWWAPKNFGDKINRRLAEHFASRNTYDGQIMIEKSKKYTAPA